jgi:outer membrane phospholipase A
MPNQPVYFIYGTGDQSAKFQFSFDYRLATLDWGKPDKEKVSTLRFGYTQRSLWDINGASSPFYDTSYIPEFVITTDAVVPKETSHWFTWIGWRGGYQHESNGRSGSDSRSINTVYLRPRFLLGSPDSWFLVVLPEIYTYVGGVSDNPSIKEYRGYGRLKLYFGHGNGPTLMFTGWAGSGFEHGSMQFDFTYPFHSHWLNIEAYLMAQYFNGYGESLLSYDKKSDALRFGIGLVR